MSGFFVHGHAICEAPADQIGEGTRIWAFAHVLPKARLGRDCNVCDGVFIENDVVVGDRVTVKCGVQLWDGLTVEDDVFIGPNATFTNDIFPRSKSYPESFARTVLRRGCSIGANATILPGVEIGSGAMVGAGAVVTRNVPPNSVVVGNPGRIVGYVGDLGGRAWESGGSRARQAAEIAEAGPAPGQSLELGVGACTLNGLKVVRDLRGDLMVGDFEKDVPFAPARFFMVYNVPSQEVRGEHAHRKCQQFLVCIRGSCSVLLDDGERRRELKLDNPSVGIFMPAMIWGTQYKYSSDAVLMVFASRLYETDDYIRTYAEFLEERGA
jgi:UDP-2-acetamido-3-amino-2,3-dideoxy-glucuronate N-acetyltransferase